MITGQVGNCRHNVSMVRELEETAMAAEMRPDSEGCSVPAANCHGEAIGNAETVTTDETLRPKGGGVHKRHRLPNGVLKRHLNGVVPTTTTGKADDKKDTRQRTSRRRVGINAAMDDELPKSRFFFQAECVHIQGG